MVYLEAVKSADSAYIWGTGRWPLYFTNGKKSGALAGTAGSEEKCVEMRDLGADYAKL